MSGHAVIVMGASAGGVEAFRRLLGTLPANFPASVLLVQHISPQSPGLLPKVIGRDSVLPVRHPVEGEENLPGQVYVAPPDLHLTLRGPLLHLSRGPRENRHRPAIDTLFRTAAEFCGQRTIGVVLTGFLDDGTAGLASIKAQGGTAVVQDPREAEAPAMPQSALRSVPVDHCVTLSEIGPLLTHLAVAPRIAGCKTPEPRAERSGMLPEEMTGNFGPPTPFVCPECSGTMWETKTGRAIQFRCHVGHTFSPQTLLAEHSNAVEDALWSVVRTLEEKAALLRRLAHESIQASAPETEFQVRAYHCERHAHMVRLLLDDL